MARSIEHEGLVNTQQSGILLLYETQLANADPISGHFAEPARPGTETQVDSLFEDWFGRSMGGVLAPRVDVAEDEKAVTLTAELPGVNEKDIDVSLVGDQLTIKGDKRSEHEEKKALEGHVVHRTERSYGAFQRTIAVPYQIDPNQVSADFKDGVLRITLPKPPDAVAQKQGQKIEVNKSSQGFDGGPTPA